MFIVNFVSGTAETEVYLGFPGSVVIRNNSRTYRLLVLDIRTLHLLLTDIGN